MNILNVKHLAQNHGLDIQENSIKLNESGVDFIVAHALDHHGVKWILRLPRRPESMRHALREKKALDIIHRQACFQVPCWSVFSEQLIAYQQLDGVPAATIDMELQDYVWRFDKTSVPSAYFDSLGEALAHLHSLPQHEFLDTGIEVLSTGELKTAMKLRMERVKEKYYVNSHLWNRWQAWLANDSLWPTHVGVTHGDLHPGHVLIEKNNFVTGLIDWTEISIGDVSADFMSHYLLFEQDGLNKLIDAYDNAGGKTWSKMPEHIVELLSTSGITVAEYAQSSGLKDMHETAVHMLSSEP